MTILASETKKSHSVKSGEYGGWGIMMTPCFAENWQIRSEF
jgi:hypothetical protein